MKYMLDTNICIYIIKKRPEKIFARFQSLGVDDICISTITLAELEYGVEKSQYHEKNRIALACFLSPLEILPFTYKAASVYGRIRATLETQGRIIDTYDLMIGAHALSENVILVTNNTGEFERIPGLALENWV